MTIFLGLAVPEGLVLATDSRQTGTSVLGLPRIDSDKARKIFPLQARLAAVIVGQSFIPTHSQNGPLSIAELLRESVKRIPTNLTVQAKAQRLLSEIRTRLKRKRKVLSGPTQDFVLYLGGVESNGIGKLVRISTHQGVRLLRHTRDGGAVWDGNSQIIERVIHGLDRATIATLLGKTNIGHKLLQTLFPQFQLNLKFHTLPLQEAIDLADALVRATIISLRLSDGTIGTPSQWTSCGGQSMLASISLENGFRWEGQPTR